MALDLPDGITFNKVEEDLLEIELPYQVVEQWSCDVCEHSLEAIIIGSDGRFEGSIRPIDSEITTWHGKLPKNEFKAKTYLLDIFRQRIIRHKGNH
jgi:hypothetical protein